MRGYASGSSLDPNFFIILDRLYEILNHRILDWKSDLHRHGLGGFSNFWQTMFCTHRKFTPKDESGRNERDHIAHDIMLQRVMVAYDLASAFAYMHENK